MFKIFKKDKDLPKSTILKTTQKGFQGQIMNLKITNKELEVFKEVYERSNIEFIIK